MYVFLDVDGVLNTEFDWEKKLYSINTRNMDVFCNLLSKLPNPKIVLSSTWRNGIARDGTTAVHIDELLHKLEIAGISSIDKTDISPDGSRTKEIDHYLRRHEQDRYIILDDDPDIFDMGSKTSNLYLINAKTGLTEKDMKMILRTCK